METSETEKLFNDNFQRVFRKQIYLHKKINNNDILLLHNFYKCVSIVDRNDIQFPEDRYPQLHNIPQTQHFDPLLRVSPYSVDTLIYPYLTMHNIEKMSKETIVSVLRTNKFLTSDFIRASLVLKLHNEIVDNESNHYIEYWMNNKIINNIKCHKREPRGALFTELVCTQAKNDILYDLDDKLNNLLLPVSEQLEHSSLLQQNLLKPNVTLFEYQLQDLQWMCNIERSIDDATNTFTYTYEITHPVFNDTFVMFDSTLYPSNLINNISKTVKVTYSGGNLVSEIGLGKTIVSLYHILSHGLHSRPQYDNFVSFGDDCNYTYKRGVKKGDHCKKKCTENGMYCKEHMKSIFIEKRNLVYKNLEQFHPRDFLIPKTLGIQEKEKKSPIDNGEICGLIKTNATLVLCPNQLCDQWVKEYYTKFTNEYRVLIVVTKDQFTNLKLSDILFADIIVVSYQFLTNDFYQKLYIKNIDMDARDIFCVGNNEKHKTATELLDSKDINLFHLFYWRMIFLDEAHEIQNMVKSNILKHTIKQLKSKSRWNVTGTPFANGISSFTNLVGFNSTFRGSCKTLDEITSCGLNAHLLQLYKGLFRRNTKQSIKQEYNGTLINESMHCLDFTHQERNIYDSYIAGGKAKYIDLLIKICCHSELYEDTKDLIKNCKTLEEIQTVMLDYNKTQLQTMSTSLKTIEDKISSIQTDITNMGYVNPHNEIEVERLNHLKILLSTSKRKHTTTKSQLDTIKRTYNYLVSSIESIQNNEETCPICLDTIDTEEKAITKCGHKFCWCCIYETHSVKQNNQRGTFSCPTCNTPITSKDIYIFKNETTVGTTDNELQEIIQKVKSTKIGNIIYYLKTQILDGDKIILFSQWDELLHKVGNMLKEHNLNIVYCNGTVFQRKRAIQSFMNPNNNINIILLSSRNAASGINLTEANKIILLEPVYGSSEYRTNIETQAIGRADRIGQKRPITVHRFIIKNTIEQDIINGNIDENEIRQLRM